jgi:hypothetical protein
MPAVLRFEIRSRYRGPAGCNAGSGGLWRSLVARFVWDEDVAGSNPVSPTSTFAGRSACVDELASGDDVIIYEDADDRQGARPSEVVALSAFPSLCTQDVGLHLGFDAFGDAGQVHSVDQPA